MVVDVRPAGTWAARVRAELLPKMSSDCSSSAASLLRGPSGRAVLVGHRPFTRDLTAAPTGGVMRRTGAQTVIVPRPSSVSQDAVQVGRERAPGRPGPVRHRRRRAARRADRATAAGRSRRRSRVIPMGLVFVRFVIAVDPSGRMTFTCPATGARGPERQLRWLPDEAGGAFPLPPPGEACRMPNPATPSTHRSSTRPRRRFRPTAATSGSGSEARSWLCRASVSSGRTMRVCPAGTVLLSDPPDHLPPVGPDRVLLDPYPPQHLDRRDLPQPHRRPPVGDRCQDPEAVYDS